MHTPTEERVDCMGRAPLREVAARWLAHRPFGRSVTVTDRASSLLRARARTGRSSPRRARVLLRSSLRAVVLPMQGRSAEVLQMFVALRSSRAIAGPVALTLALAGCLYPTGDLLPAGTDKSAAHEESNEGTEKPAAVNGYPAFGYGYGYPGCGAYATGYETTWPGWYAPPVPPGYPGYGIFGYGAPGPPWSYPGETYEGSGARPGAGYGAGVPTYGAPDVPPSGGAGEGSKGSAGAPAPGASGNGPVAGPNGGAGPGGYGARGGGPNGGGPAAGSNVGAGPSGYGAPGGLYTGAGPYGGAPFSENPYSPGGALGPPLLFGLGAPVPPGFPYPGSQLAALGYEFRGIAEGYPPVEIGAGGPAGYGGGAPGYGGPAGGGGYGPYAGSPGYGAVPAGTGYGPNGGSPGYAGAPTGAGYGPNGGSPGYGAAPGGSGSNDKSPGDGYGGVPVGKYPPMPPPYLCGGYGP